MMMLWTLQIGLSAAQVIHSDLIQDNQVLHAATDIIEDILAFSCNLGMVYCSWYWSRSKKLLHRLLQCSSASRTPSLLSLLLLISVPFVNLAIFAYFDFYSEHPGGDSGLYSLLIINRRYMYAIPMAILVSMQMFVYSAFVSVLSAVYDERLKPQLDANVKDWKKLVDQLDEMMRRFVEQTQYLAAVSIGLNLPVFVAILCYFAGVLGDGTHVNMIPPLCMRFFCLAVTLYFVHWHNQKVVDRMYTDVHDALLRCDEFDPSDFDDLERLYFGMRYKVYGADFTLGLVVGITCSVGPIVVYALRAVASVSSNV
jgi:hypothetical protein